VTKRRFPQWEEVFQNALAELDLKKLPGRVADAETAIVRRMEQLVRLPNEHVERRAIMEALDALYGLKRDKLSFPDWRCKAHA